MFNERYSQNIPTEIKNMLESLVEKYDSQIQGVWLIGSRANNTQRDDSDWDFIIKGDEDVLNHIKENPDEFDFEGIDLLIVFDGDQFEDPFSDKTGSLTEWKWEEYPEENEYIYRGSLNNNIEGIQYPTRDAIKIYPE